MENLEVSTSKQGSSVKLSRSPLVRVLAQVRWPELGGFDVEVVARAVGVGLASEYPLVAKQSENQVILTPDGVQQQSTGVMFRFASVDEAWTVSLGKTFLGIETVSYLDHEDFVARFRRALEVLVTASSIPKWSRIGYRYTNRLTGEDLKSLGQYFDPMVLGGVPAARDGIELVHSISESLYKIDNAMLLTRSARLGNGASLDPTLPAVDGDSWVLDLDAFEEASSVYAFSPEAVSRRASELSRVASSHFESVVSQDFRERFK